MTDYNEYELAKIVRDHSQARMESDGCEVNSRTLQGEELPKELIKKLVEESQELLEETEPQEHVNELADLYEIMRALYAAYNTTEEEVIKAATEKRKIRGGYKNNQYVSTVICPVGGRFDTYFGSKPEQYPLIK